MLTVGNVSCEQGLHWRYLPPAKPGWDTMLKNAELINRLDQEGLSKQKGVNKSAYDQFVRMFNVLQHPVCERCEKDLGPVDEWGTDKCLFVDSLSGINIMAMDLVVGAKPVKSQGDWGIAMDNLERFINQLTTGLHCHAVLTAHLDREIDEVSGGNKLMTATLGRKLAPRIPRFFDEVIMAYRDGQEFFWSTAAPGADLKTRILPVQDKLPPDFARLLKGWKDMGGAIEENE